MFEVPFGHLFLSTRFMCSNWSFKSTPFMLWLQSIMHQVVTDSFPLLETLCVSALWYVDTVVTFLSSRHFSAVTEPEELDTISPFSSFLSFTSLGTFFLFRFSVPTRSVDCSIFSLLANSGQLKKLSSHSVFPQPNKSSRSSSTIAAVVGVTGVIRLDCRTVFLSVHTRKHHKYAVLDPHSSIVAMPPVLPLSQQLNIVHWLKTCRANTSNYWTYVDSYTKWKAELFSAYLQKELTHDISAYFEAAADMKPTQSRELRRGKYFKLQNAV